MRIGVVGNGFVGQATRCFAGGRVSVLAYDKDPSLCEPAGTSMQDVASCDLVFVSVPTPMKPCGLCCTGIVEEVVSELRSLGATDIVVRSTVPPGTCAELKVHFLPEFLTERNFIPDFKATPVWVVGTNSEDGSFKQKIQYLLGICKEDGKVCSDTTEFVTTTEGELIKYFRNTFLATKVTFCNEFASICQASGVSYDIVRGIAANDPRIGLSHTGVPGPDGVMGFGGTCLPKDIHAITRAASKQWVPCPLLEAVISRNESIDRPQKDWQLDKGRAVV